jgi:hypothetical protein
MWLKQRQLSIATESIDFQSDAFFKELVSIVKELQGVKSEEIPGHEAALQLPSLIAHYTGLNIRVVWGENGHQVTAPRVTKNHPLLSLWADWFRQAVVPNADGEKLIADSKTNPMGRVNLKTGRVSGVFSTIQSDLDLPLDSLVDKFYRPEEYAALALHELGHLEAYYELIACTLSTNQILAGLAKKLDQSAGPKDREAVLTRLKSVAELNDLDVQALAKSSDKKVVETVVVTSIAKQIESEIGSNLYDMNSWEMLADQFAARFGAGRHVVTALDKSRRSRGDIAYRGTATYLMIEAYKLLLLAAGPFSFGLSWLYLLFLSASDGNDKSGTYDTLRTRYMRVREQIVEAMKDKRITAEQQASYADDIATIDEILTFAKDRQQLLGYVRDFLSPIQRRRISQEKLQRELESIANNDLFVKAASLRQLGT